MDPQSRIDDLEKKFNENPRRYFAPLANEYRKAGNPKQAIAVCRAHLNQLSGHMSGQIVYGQSLFAAGEYDESRSVFEAALAMDPENLIALRHLGDLAMRADHGDQAAQWYRRLLEADPKDAEVMGLMRQLGASSEVPTVDAEDATDRPAVSEPVTEPGDAEHATDTPAVSELVSEMDAAPESHNGFVGGRTGEFVRMTHDSDPPSGAVLGEDAIPIEEAAASTAPMVESQPEAAPPEAIQVDMPPDEPRVDTPPDATQVDTQADAPAKNEYATRTRNTPAFVTETMAELYIAQGFQDLARDVYKQLIAGRPDDERLKSKLAELEASLGEIAARRDEPPSVESPQIEPVTPRAPSIEFPLDSPGSAPAPSEESPDGDRDSVDSPPSQSPPSEGDSVESPSAPEPRAEPEGSAMRGPTVREFFATLGRRRPTSRPASPATPPAAREVHLAASGFSPSAESLDSVFAGAGVGAEDARAAASLAGAFGGGAGRSASPMPQPASAAPGAGKESEEDVARFRAWLDGLTAQ